jgi:hypothetical protein
MARSHLRGKWGPHQRWIAINSVIVSAVANFAVNAGIAWFIVQGRPTVPLWPANSLVSPSIFTDTVSTLFTLPLVTCVLCTRAVWRELASRRLTPLNPAGLWHVLAWLPESTWRRALLLGGISVLLLTPPVTLLFVLLHAQDLSNGEFLLYKPLFAAALGLFVTPLIAWRAMTDKVVVSA